jgi:hypothetical protein
MNGVVAPWLRISCRQRNPAGPTKDRDFPNDKFPSNDSDTRSTEPREHTYMWPDSNGVRNLLTHEFFGFEGQQKIKNGDF